MSEIFPQHQYIARNKTFKNLNFTSGDYSYESFVIKIKD